MLRLRQRRRPRSSRRRRRCPKVGPGLPRAEKDAAMDADRPRLLSPLRAISPSTACSTRADDRRASSPTSTPGASFLAALARRAARLVRRRAACMARTELQQARSTRTRTGRRCERLARDPRLVGLVEQILGAGVSVYFSQIFFKAPEGGGPKPAHQDNFTSGPTDPRAASSPRGSRSTTRRSRTAASTSAKARTTARSHGTSRRAAELFNPQLPAGGARRQAADERPRRCARAA